MPSMMCQSHWDKLREKIEAAGLNSLVAENGEEAAAKMARSFEEQETTFDNFEPLQYAMFMLVNNCYDVVNGTGASPLYFLTEGPDDPVDDKEFPKAKGKNLVWPRGCPLCYINLAHELSCSGCLRPQVGGFDEWLDFAVRDTVKKWKELGGGA